MRNSMPRWAKFVWTILVFAIIVWMPNNQAHAYLDPGSSSFIIQIIVAGLLGMVMTLRFYWVRITNAIRNLLGIKSEAKIDDDISDI